MQYPGYKRSVPSFALGGQGMVYGYPPAYADLAKIDPDLVNQFGGPVVMKNRVQAAYIYPDWIYITTQSKHPNEAWAFMQWLTRGRNLADLMSLGPYPPSRRAAFDHPFYRSPNGQLAVRMFTESTLPYGTGFKPRPGYTLWTSQAINPVWTRITDGEISPRAGLEELERRLGALVADQVTRR